MSAFIQILAGCLGTMGFSVLFNVRGRKLVFATLGGLISWAVFLALEPVFNSEALRYFVSAVAITVYAEILARLERTPTTMFLVPAIIPLVPGGALYYTMNYALNKQWFQFAHQAFYTLQLALSLAVGIIAVTTVVRLLTAFMHRSKNRDHSFHHSIK